MIAELKSLTKSERSVFASSGIGWSIDSMDMNMFSLVVPSLLIAFAIDRGQAGILATAALMSSAVGGWLAGILSDRYGRLVILRVTVAWFSIATIACAFTHDYNVFLGLRILQGLGFGGEWAVGAVLIAEVIRSDIRGKIVGIVQSGFAIGWGLALLLFYCLFAGSTDENSWRYFFLVAGALGIPLFIGRMLMKLPPEYYEYVEKNKKSGEPTQVLDIFRTPYLRNTTLATIMCTALQTGSLCLLVWLPTFLLQSRHLSVIQTSSYLAVLVTGAFIGFLCGAYLSDLIGRRRKIMMFSVGSFITVVGYLLYPTNGPVMLGMGFFLGFFVFGIYSGIGPLLSELFPIRIRGAGQGFCYNFGRGVGAVLPAVIGFVSQNLGLGEAIAIFAGVAYFIVCVSVYLLPETTGIDLKRVDAQSEASRKPAIKSAHGIAVKSNA